MIILKLCLVICLIFPILGCKVNDQSELYGTYNADYAIAKEELTLHKNGTFTQKVTLKATSKIDTTNGTWIYDPPSGYLRFSNFMNVVKRFRELNPDYSKNPEDAVLPASKYFGFVMLGAAEGVLYKKYPSLWSDKGKR